MRLLPKVLIFTSILLLTTPSFSGPLLRQSEGLLSLNIEPDIESPKFEVYTEFNTEGKALGSYVKYPEKDDTIKYINQTLRNCEPTLNHYVKSLQKELKEEGLKAHIVDTKCELENKTYKMNGKDYGAYRGIVSIKYLVLEK